jgi:hypothetical protein
MSIEDSVDDPWIPSTQDEQAAWARSVFSVQGAYRFTESELNGISLNEFDRSFLTTVGLPRESGAMWLSFNPAQYGLRKPDQDDFPCLPKQLYEGDWRLIGGEEFDSLCVDLSTGCVRSFTKSGAPITRYVNSSIARLGMCLASYLVAFSEAKPREIAHREACERVKAFDPYAWTDDDCYWPIVLPSLESDY